MIIAVVISHGSQLLTGQARGFPAHGNEVSSDAAGYEVISKKAIPKDGIVGYEVI